MTNSDYAALLDERKKLEEYFAKTPNIDSIDMDRLGGKLRKVNFLIWQADGINPPSASSMFKPIDAPAGFAAEIKGVVVK